MWQLKSLSFEGKHSWFSLNSLDFSFWNLCMWVKSSTHTNLSHPWDRASPLKRQSRSPFSQHTTSLSSVVVQMYYNNNIFTTSILIIIALLLCCWSRLRKQMYNNSYHCIANPHQLSDTAAICSNTFSIAFLYLSEKHICCWRGFHPILSFTTIGSICFKWFWTLFAVHDNICIIST